MISPCRAALRNPAYRTRSEQLGLCLAGCDPCFRGLGPSKRCCRAGSEQLGLCLDECDPPSSRPRDPGVPRAFSGAPAQGPARFFYQFVSVRGLQGDLRARREALRIIIMVFALLAQPPGLGVVKAIRVRIGAKPPRAFMPRDRRALGTRNR